MAWVIATASGWSGRSRTNERSIAMAVSGRRRSATKLPNPVPKLSSNRPTPKSRNPDRMMSVSIPPASSVSSVISSSSRSGARPEFTSAALTWARITADRTCRPDTFTHTDGPAQPAAAWHARLNTQPPKVSDSLVRSANGRMASGITIPRRLTGQRISASYAMTRPVPRPTRV